MTIVNSILLGLAIGIADAIGFIWVIKQFGTAHGDAGKKIGAMVGEIVKVVLLCIILVILCTKAHVAAAWLIASALFSSLLGKSFLALKTMGPKT